MSLPLKRTGYAYHWAAMVELKRVNRSRFDANMRHLFVAVFMLAIPLVSLAASISVSQDQFKDSWPLAVTSGTLKCEPVPGSPKMHLVTFSSGGKVYALNGIARGHAKKRGWLEVRSIWKDNPEIPGAKISIGPLIDHGLGLCK